ncbi:MAG TPA: methyltransferase domain-containing protein [Verrucomicrobiae bacterium]|nr:methyltransferase domain-containing protein [Verrucomicrobiae bacterium]
MSPGFEPCKLAARYDVEQFSEDAWHAYSGGQTAKFLRIHIKANPPEASLLLNAGAGVYDIGIPGWTEIPFDLFDAPIRNRPNAVCGSVEKMPFQSAMFNAVVCVGEVLGYCDPHKAIQEFARVLKPGGIVVCDFGSTKSLRRCFNQEYGRAADLVTDQYNDSPEPIWVYDPAYIHSHLKAAGFRIAAVYGTHTWSAIARKMGVGGERAMKIQRRMEWLPIPAVCADVVTIVAARL